MSSLAITITISLLGVFIAFVGGMLSVISPCVLPILPGLAGITTGLSLKELEDSKKLKRKLVAMCLSFSLGFTVVFVLIGLAATQVSHSLISNKEILTRVSGVILIILSIFFLLSFYTKFRIFNFEKKVRFSKSLSAVPVIFIGAGFALGWSPCLGPVLAGVLTVASSEQSLLGRIAILLSYCIGLCLAMSLIVIASFRYKKLVVFIKKHTQFFTILTFVIMLGFGLLLFFDSMAYLTARFTQFFDFIGLDKISNGI